MSPNTTFRTKLNLLNVTHLVATLMTIGLRFYAGQTLCKSAYVPDQKCLTIHQYFLSTLTYFLQLLIKQILLVDDNFATGNGLTSRDNKI